MPNNNSPNQQPTPTATPAATPAAAPAAPTTQSGTTTQPTTQNFTPNASTGGIEVRAVNPPLTPDQIVGLYDTPVATPKLPTLKLENIKTPNIKNKTIQGYLKAIEAKMLSTEKLMKDIIKLQNVQIITEKEVNLKKRELYNNTFQEYLLDKTIDFGEKKKKGCVCINLPENKPDTGGILATPPRRTPQTKKQKQKQKQKQTQTQTQTNKAPAPVPAPGQTAPAPGPVPAPGQTAPAPGPVQKPWWQQLQLPQTPKIDWSLPILPPIAPPRLPDFAYKNPFKGTGTIVDKALTGLTGDVKNAFDFKKNPITMPSMEQIYKTGEAAAAAVGPAATAVGEVAKPAAAAVGTAVLRQLVPQGYAAGGLVKPSRASGGIEKISHFLPQSTVMGYIENAPQAKGGVTIPDPVTTPITSPANNRVPFTRAPVPELVPSRASGGIEKISHFLPQSTVMGYIDNAPRARGGVTIPDPVTTLTRDVRTAAGGGMKDLELYNDDSLNYFRNMSSTVMTKAADGGVFDMFNKPKGLNIKGAQAGFTGMGKQGFDAIMGGDKFKLGSFKPQILGRGAYSAPTVKGAQRYAGSQGSLGGRQTPGGVVKSIVPSGARRINFLEPQAAVKPATFDKGKALADKLLKGTYSKSPLANKLRNQLLSGGASAGSDLLKIGKLGGKLLGAAGPILDLAFPEPTAQYDQISGPNSFKNNPTLQNNPAYKKLEMTQNNLTSKTNNTPTVVPLPPEYIKIPGRKSSKEKDMSTLAPPPGVKDKQPTIFTREIGVYK